ncbi:rod shape-determining protein MreD [Rossellomorea sp. BNER]|jgi:rod shape-determining protein MreD|uniref:rod shape-determining protein MreD n=1 Tax=Rossellomorea sp. BNER TaxID=2962031 RepID=UPI003AF2A37E|nr:rod shape-determining protein MreD [Rossellomorea sp. BNER]
MMKRLLLPFLALMILYSESIFVRVFPIELLEGHRIVVPHFLQIFILFMAVFYHYRSAIVYAFVFGFLFDLFYTEIIGIYMLIFPLTIFLMDKMMKILHNNLFVVGISMIINISILELLVYQLNFIIQRTDFTLFQFADWRLWPTLVLNAVFIIIFSYPVKLLMNKLRKEFIDH